MNDVYHRKNRVPSANWALLVVLIGGCSVSGTWKRVATDPPNAPFPVDDLFLGDDGSYQARWKHDGRQYGNHGTYEYAGGELAVAQYGMSPQKYGARLRLDGKLELTLTVNEHTIKAVMERQQPPKPEDEGQSPTAPYEINRGGPELKTSTDPRKREQRQKPK